MAKRGAPRNATALLGRSFGPGHFLKQHVSLEMAEARAVRAAGHALASGLREEGIGFLLARNVFGRGRYVVEDGHEIEIRLAIPGVDVGQDMIAFDPALRLLELHVLAIFAGEEVGIVAEMPVIDRDRTNVPILARLQWQFLSGRWNGRQHRRRAERGKQHLTHMIFPECRRDLRRPDRPEGPVLKLNWER